MPNGQRFHIECEDEADLERCIRIYEEEGFSVRPQGLTLWVSAVVYNETKDEQDDK